MVSWWTSFKVKSPVIDRRAVGQPPSLGLHACPLACVLKASRLIIPEQFCDLPPELHTSLPVASPLWKPKDKPRKARYRCRRGLCSSSDRADGQAARQIHDESIQHVPYRMFDGMPVVLHRLLSPL